MVRAGREIVNRYSWETIFKISGLNAHKAYLWRQYESVVDKMTDHVPFADEAVRRMSDEAFVGHYRDTLTLPAQLENIGTWGLALHIGRLIFESPTPPYYNFSEGCAPFHPGQGGVCAHRSGRCLPPHQGVGASAHRGAPLRRPRQLHRPAQVAFAATRPAFRHSIASQRISQVIHFWG